MRHWSRSDAFQREVFDGVGVELNQVFGQLGGGRVTGTFALFA
jgi:hypothetical protein